jgi:hypothetical protein
MLRDPAAVRSSAAPPTCRDSLIVSARYALSPKFREGKSVRDKAPHGTVRCLVDQSSRFPSVPTEDDYRLARRATAYLTTDHVKPTQAATYRRVLRSGPTGDPLRDFLTGMSRPEIERLTAGDLRSELPPRLVVRKLEALFDQIEKPAHRWIKGMMAAALALDDERPSSNAQTDQLDV